MSRDVEGAAALDAAIDYDAKSLLVLERLRASRDEAERSELWSLYVDLSLEAERAQERWWDARVASGFAEYPRAARPEPQARRDLDDWTQTEELL